MNIIRKQRKVRKTTPYQDDGVEDRAGPGDEVILIDNMGRVDYDQGEEMEEEEVSDDGSSILDTLSEDPSYRGDEEERVEESDVELGEDQFEKNDRNLEREESDNDQEEEEDIIIEPEKRESEESSGDSAYQESFEDFEVVKKNQTTGGQKTNKKVMKTQPREMMKRTTTTTTTTTTGTKKTPPAAFAKAKGAKYLSSSSTPLENKKKAIPAGPSSSSARSKPVTKKGNQKTDEKDHVQYHKEKKVTSPVSDNKGKGKKAAKASATRAKSSIRSPTSVALLVETMQVGEKTNMEKTQKVLEKEKTPDNDGSPPAKRRMSSGSERGTATTTTTTTTTTMAAMKGSIITASQCIQVMTDFTVGPEEGKYNYYPLRPPIYIFGMPSLLIVFYFPKTFFFLELECHPFRIIEKQNSVPGIRYIENL